LPFVCLSSVACRCWHVSSVKLQMYSHRKISIRSSILKLIK
jgi:hypothetical protein